MKYIFKQKFALSLCMFSMLAGGCSSAKQLETPRAILSGDVLSWRAVQNADGYVVKVNDDIYNTSLNSYTIQVNELGTYSVSVKATDSTGKYADSEFTATFTYRKTSLSKLSAPVISIDNKGLVSWSAVTGATSYEVHIGLAKVGVTTTYYQVPSTTENSTVIYVVAKSNVEGVAESDASNTVTYNANSNEKDFFLVNLMNEGTMALNGTFKDVLDVVNERQLYDDKLWARFVEQYRHNSDGQGWGWRGEFWGKMMEGACITYASTHDQKLYNVLKLTVQDMLTTQHPDGNFTTYGTYSDTTGNQEFHGWDVWCRLWTLNGLLYFYNICKEQALKTRVLTALTRNLDFLCTKIGDGEGKMDIRATGSEWGGLPVSGILEPVCKLYRITKKAEYFELATHIINGGGSFYGNQIEQALANTTPCYTWGSPKAGELSMFFDGVLEYYFITGIEKYKTAAINYWKNVDQNEFMVSGQLCSKDECFENSVVEQSNPDKTGGMGEFCVTIHWLNLSKDLYQLTGDPYIIDRMERTIYNAVLGCVDFDGCYDHVFNSYNALMFVVRSTSAAGGMSLKYPYNWSYGCCISQGSIATGLIPQLQHAKDASGIYANLYMPGTITDKLVSGNNVSITTEANYPNENTVKLTLGLAQSEKFAFNVRIPYWSATTVVKVNGTPVEGTITAGKYFKVNRNWSNGDTVELEFTMDVTEVWGSAESFNSNAQYNVCLMRGPICFARDARLDGGNIYETVSFEHNTNGSVKYSISNTSNFRHIVEIEVKNTKTGNNIHLVNLGDAGKTFSAASTYAAFLPTTDYWKPVLNSPKGVYLVNCQFNALCVQGANNNIFLGSAASDYSSFDEFAMEFIKDGDGYFIKHKQSGKYLTLVGDYFQYAAYTGAANQKYTLKHAGLSSFKIVTSSGYLFCADSTVDKPLHIYSDCNVRSQFWNIIAID